MSTTQQTSGSNTSTLQFNPMAQQMYNQLVGSGGKTLQGYINNPFGNAMYTMGAGQSAKAAAQAGQNNMNMLGQNQKVSGLTGQAGAGWLAAQKAITGRANQAMSSQAQTSNVLAALQRQMAATGMGLSFSPQLTGQTGNFNQTQTTSGTGTWLPQLMGAGMSAALGMATGGMSSAAGGFGSVGGVSNPGLGSPSYMPGGGGGFSGFGAPSMSSVMSSIPTPTMPPLSMMGYGG